MASRRAITSVGCSHCRLGILKLFASPANALSSVRAGPIQSRPWLIPAAPIRPFSSRQAQSEPLDDAEPVEEDPEEDDATKGSGLTNIPWYLQVEPPRHVASIEPPPLPEIPTDSPEVIGPLLEYISEDLGLHELSLLDLRELDPPAALGPNLFMLFGTARSERHLNVSAGRLLRWLRAKHRIYALADGLLGPNERKTKLRRIAKRAKLIGGAPEGADDGIKTGWICVNLGTIGRSNDESAVIAEDGRVAGFGISQTGHTIVVQIMTESRRAEMGLEHLWGKAMDEPVDDSSKSEMESVEDLHPLERAILSNTPPSAITRGEQFYDTSRKKPFEQRRTYSTQKTMVDDAAKTEALFTIDSRESLEQVLKVDARQKSRILDLLQVRLGEMSSEERRQALGMSEESVTTTPFNRLSKLACQSLHPHQTWGFRLAVQARACESSKQNPVEFLNAQGLLDELNIYGIEATREQYLQLLACIYSSASGIENQHKLAQQLLRTMQQRGEPVIANDIIVTIVETVCRHFEKYGWNGYLKLIQQLEDNLPHLNLPCMEEPLLMRLMTAHHRVHRWQAFWNVWHMPPKYLRPRSAAIYTHIYQLAAPSGSRSICAQIVRRTFQGMLAEDPPVLPNKAVAKALVDCIRVADSYAEDIAARATQSKREFVKILQILRLIET
ncbi:hypothetical protein F4781DRAFT_68182 [Annulohypoxylon bovei var. microspora]|nr:hypothetical protein F4781DRAFT_68182 [Annulohypoxylon bovei var. microspora]